MVAVGRFNMDDEGRHTCHYISMYWLLYILLHVVLLQPSTSLLFSQTHTNTNTIIEKKQEAKGNQEESERERENRLYLEEQSV